MKVREHRKHRVNEKSSRKLSSELLALTKGVSLFIKNNFATIIVRSTPNKEKNTRTIPITSVKVRNSTVFRTHSSLFSLDQKSSGHFVQPLESVMKMSYQRNTCIKDCTRAVFSIMHRVTQTKDVCFTVIVWCVICIPVVLLISPSAQSIQS